MKMKPLHNVEPFYSLIGEFSNSKKKQNREECKWWKNHTFPLKDFKEQG